MVRARGESVGTLLQPGHDHRCCQAMENQACGRYVFTILPAPVQTKIYYFKLQNSVFKSMHECKYSKICLLDCVPHVQMKTNIVLGNLYRWLND